MQRCDGSSAAPKTLNTAHTKAATKIAQQNWGQFVIADRVTDEVLGSGDISRKRGPWEISFQLRQASWGQGLATEAVTLVIELFFGHTDESVLIAVTQEANVRCSRLLERLGATMTGTFDQYGLTQRRYEFSRPGIHKPGK